MANVTPEIEKAAVDSISFGSTGIHPAHYDGEWPDGRWWVHDAHDLWPGDPVMVRKRDPHLTQSEGE